MINFKSRPFWRSRQPIGIEHFGDGEHTGASAINPKGWFYDPTCNITGDVNNFHIRAQQRADESLIHLTNCHCQGVILWQLEGWAPGMPVYLGDPRKIFDLNPEWLHGMTNPKTLEGSIFRRYLNRYTDVGLKIGVVVRPHDYNFDTATFVTHPNPTLNLWRKCRFAYDRFGARIFYVDTNDADAPGGDILPAIVFEHLHKLLPDCLFIPEHEEGGYYRDCAPWGDIADGYKPTPAYIRKYYPNAFRCVNISGANVDQFNALIENPGGRDIVMFNDWFPSAEEALITGALGDGGTDGSGD